MLESSFSYFDLIQLFSVSRKWMRICKYILGSKKNITVHYKYLRPILALCRNLKEITVTGKDPEFPRVDFPESLEKIHISGKAHIRNIICHPTLCEKVTSLNLVNIYGFCASQTFGSLECVHIHDFDVTRVTSIFFPNSLKKISISILNDDGSDTFCIQTLLGQLTSLEHLEEFTLIGKRRTCNNCIRYYSQLTKLKRIKFKNCHGWKSEILQTIFNLPVIEKISFSGFSVRSNEPPSFDTISISASLKKINAKNISQEFGDFLLGVSRKFNL